jgi:hypothetical protein
MRVAVVFNPEPRRLRRCSGARFVSTVSRVVYHMTQALDPIPQARIERPAVAGARAEALF